MINRLIRQPGHLMKIAVASQNRKAITGHTGRCRKFWLYQIENNTVLSKDLLELTQEQSFHETSRHDPTPLDAINLLICGGIGDGLAKRLQEKNIQTLVTSESDPDTAIEAFLQGRLKTEAIDPPTHDHRHRKSTE